MPWMYQVECLSPEEHKDEDTVMTTTANPDLLVRVINVELAHRHEVKVSKIILEM